jgi:formate dehydrogenase accessory protein FdhD
MNQLDVASQKVSSNNDICLLEKIHTIQFNDYQWAVPATGQLSEYLIQGLLYMELNIASPLTIHRDHNHVHQVTLSNEPHQPLTPSPMMHLQHHHIIDWVKAFKSQQTLYHQTGATHSAGFIANEAHVRTIECLTLKTCMLKLLGSIIKKHIEYVPILLISHRILSEDVPLLLKFQPQVLICQSAISANAIDILKSYQITVFGFCRKNKFNRYSNFHL